MHGTIPWGLAGRSSIDCYPSRPLGGAQGSGAQAGVGDGYSYSAMCLHPLLSCPLPQSTGMSSPPTGDAPIHDRAAFRAAFAGEWTVAYSTSKLWTDGKRHRPYFRYDPIEESSATFKDATFADELVDSSRDPPLTRKTVMEGTSTQDGAEPWKFRWRGAGLYRLISMDWRVIHFSTRDGVAATCFTKTFHSDAACSVLVRDPKQAIPSAIEEAKDAILRQPNHLSLGPILPAAGSVFDKQ
jgi:hypothetical protein